MLLDLVLLVIAILPVHRRTHVQYHHRRSSVKPFPSVRYLHATLGTRHSATLIVLPKVRIHEVNLYGLPKVCRAWICPPDLCNTGTNMGTTSTMAQGLLAAPTQRNRFANKSSKPSPTLYRRGKVVRVRPPNYGPNYVKW